MSTKVTAGTVSDVINLFKNVSNALVNSINKLVDWGLKISDAEEADGVYSYSISTEGGNVAKVKLTPVMNKDGVFNVEVKAKKGGKSVKYRNIKAEDIDDTISDSVNELFQEDISEKSTKASRKLKVTLKRVCSSRGDTINLTAVQANYSASEALNDLTTILSDDTFADTITTEPTSFEIIDEGDSFDVNVTECSPEVDPAYIFTEMMTAAYTLLYNVQCVHWNAKGYNFHTLHNILNDYYYTINYQIDTAAEWCVEFSGWAPHPSSLLFPDCEWGSVIPAGFTAESGFDIIRTSIQDYVSTLELYYCNVDHDIQSVLDEWIRGWKSASDYIITRILKQ